MADSELSGMLASAVVKVARDKLGTALENLAATTMPDDEKLRRHMEDLKDRIEDMAEVVGDAERRSIREKEVRSWLMRLEDAAYDIWDMVDELQANKWKQVTEVHRPCIPIATARKGRSMVTRMLKAKENLDELLQLLHGLESSLAFRRDADKGKMEQSADDAYPITLSFAATDNNEDYIVGALEDYIVGAHICRQHIVDEILSAARDSSTGLFIIAIVGMGGIGKTTLANMVFSDAATKISDYARAWVTVGREFDLKEIGNCILSQLSNKGEHQDSSDVESIAKHLDELLLLRGGGKKLLVVLDSLWSTNSSDLEDLRRMLGEGKEDRKVIVMVTTRNFIFVEALAPMFIFQMLPLSQDESWHLLKRKLGFVAARQDLESHLLQKCRGFPLAIHAIGSTLRSKSPEEIISVLNSDVREEDYGYAFPALLATYLCMPPNLRLCFAYCAIFPQGHNILKDDLIHHWMALQLIEPSDTLSTTQLATRYIGKLLDMSFLQHTMHPSDDGCAVSFTLHALVHDLAKYIWTRNLIVLDGTNSYQPLWSSQKNSYRQAWLTDSDITPADLSYILSAQLGVLLFYGCSDKQISDDSFLSAKYLRVLDLRDCRLQKLPDSIFQLKQLRYLNLSGSTRLVNLPDAFGNLINLGHIDLSSCSGLSKLPDSFGNLTNVVHVNLSGCVGLKSLPESFGLLEKLEYLDLSSCSCLDEGIQKALGRLTNLQHLNLSHPCCYVAQHRYHLRGLRDVWVKLTNLRHLNLSMCLNPIFCYLPEERTEYIESISCLHTLEHLDLSHNIFLFDIPRSLGQLSQLQTLNLSGCTRLKRIEKWMGERNFPSNSLVVSNCVGLEMYQFVVRTDGGTKRSNLPQLKDVICKELEISCLEKVISTKEAQRIGLTEKKQLQKLALVWSVAPEGASFEDHKALLEELVPPQNLQCFQLHGYSSEHLPTWLASRLSSHLSNLVEVSLVDIPSCSNLPPFGVLPNLQRLILRRVAKVTRIDPGCLTGGRKPAFHRLLHVTLDDMVNLEEFSNCSSDELVMLMFPTLDELVINKCPKLKFGDSPPKARMLVISDCDHLMSTPVKRGEHEALEDPSSSTRTVIKRSPVEVVIESCEAPLDESKWSLLEGLTPLHSLHIRNCSEKIISPEIMKGLLSSLKLLCFSHCDSMTNLPEHVVQGTSLQELIIHECRGIKSLPQSTCEEKKKNYTSEEKQKHYPLLRIRGCPDLEQWCELEENKMKLAHIQIIFEDSGTRE